MSGTLSRRDFLRWSAMATGAALLAACAPKAAPAPTEAPTEVVQEATAAPAATTVPTEAATAAPAKEVTLRFASFDWGSYGEMSEPDFWAKVAWPKFQETHPNIKFAFEPLGDGWETKTMTQAAAGTAPDLLCTWSPITEMWAEKGVLLDLQPLVDRDIPDADQRFVPFIWQQMINPFNHIRMAVPLSLDITSVYYAKQAWQEAGVPLPTTDWTLEDYAAAACNLVTKDASGKLTRWGGCFRYAGDWWNGYFFYVEAFGGQIRDEDTRMKCLLGEPETQEALEWIRKLMWEQNCFVQPNQVNSAGLADFWSGAMPAGLIASTEQSICVTYLVVNAPGTDWDIAHIPQGPKGRASMGIPGVFVMYKGVKERGTQDAAWEMMKFMIDEWFQAETMALTAYGPVLNSLLDKWISSVRAQFPELEGKRLETLTEAVRMGYPKQTPMFRYQTVAQEIIDPAMEAIFVTGEKPVSSLKDIIEKVDKSQEDALARANA